MSTTDAPGASPQVVPPPRRGSLFSVRGGLLLWLILCLFQTGLLGAWCGMWLSARPSEGEPTPPVLHTPSFTDEIGAEAPPGKGVGDLARGDELLTDGRYEAASACYEPLAASSGPLGSAIRYRLALCQEGLGRWDQAIALFREAATRDASKRLAAAAELGQARVWVRMRKPVEAKRLLCDLILRGGEPALREHDMIGDARYLLALALSAEVTRPGTPGPLKDEIAPSHIPEWSAERLLAMAPSGKTEESAAKEAGEIAVRRVGPTVADLHVSGAATQADVAGLIERLARSGGMSVEWSAGARDQAAGRTATAALESVSLVEVLHSLTLPLGLAWRVEDRLVRLQREDELTADALTAYRTETTRQALQSSLLASPDQPLSAAAMLELGNLEAAAGGRASAAAAYERLIRERPRASALTEAYFNLGIVRERLDEGEAARAAYYQVVDRAPAHELAPVAYVKIGRSYLDQGEYEQAISPLRRAVAAAAGTTSQPAAVLALAAAYLLTGNPRAANAVLVEFREVTALEPFRATTAFLDALAHYRTAVDRLQIKREASGVLAALLATPEESVLGPAGLLLMGQAYGELGFGDRMARSYQRALPQARGSLAGELTCLTADALAANNQRAAAVKMLEPLAAQEGKPWSARATFRLAEFALEDKRPDDCLQQCARLQRLKSEDEPLPYLKLMGQAYVQLGNSRQAARCFGGLWPEQ